MLILIGPIRFDSNLTNPDKIRKYDFTLLFFYPTHHSLSHFIIPQLDIHPFATPKSHSAPVSSVTSCCPVGHPMTHHPNKHLQGPVVLLLLRQPQREPLEEILLQDPTCHLGRRPPPFHLILVCLHVPSSSTSSNDDYLLNGVVNYWVQWSIVDV